MALCFVRWLAEANAPDFRHWTSPWRNFGQKNVTWKHVSKAGASACGGSRHEVDILQWLSKGTGLTAEHFKDSVSRLWGAVAFSRGGVADGVFVHGSRAMCRLECHFVGGGNVWVLVQGGKSGRTNGCKVPSRGLKPGLQRRGTV